MLAVPQVCDCLSAGRADLERHRIPELVEQPAMAAEDAVERRFVRCRDVIGLELFKICQGEQSQEEISKESRRNPFRFSARKPPNVATPPCS